MSLEIDIIRFSYVPGESGLHSFLSHPASLLTAAQPGSSARVKSLELDKIMIALFSFTHTHKFTHLMLSCIISLPPVTVTAFLTPIAEHRLMVTCFCLTVLVS